MFVALLVIDLKIVSDFQAGISRRVMSSQMAVNISNLGEEECSSKHALLFFSLSLQIRGCMIILRPVNCYEDLYYIVVWK